MGLMTASSLAGTYSNSASLRVNHIQHLNKNTSAVHSANLSTDYFTNRQDRYIKFGETKALSNYFSDLLETVGSFSYTLQPPVPTKDSAASYSLQLQNTADPVLSSSEFKTQAYSRMRDFLTKYSDNNANQSQASSAELDTVVYPIVQMAPLGIRQDEKATLRILDVIHEHGQGLTPKEYMQVHLTSGYFNFTQRYKEYILKTAAKFEFLTASPTVSHLI
jgi:CDP-diacylglycerol--glycerol-3-phosphate 3-phosphatidyltransferase